MNDIPPKLPPANPYAEEVSPDSLMSDFRGRSIMTILTVTMLVHVVLIGLCSIGYLGTQIFGENTLSLSEEERMDLAVSEATRSLREIAQRHGVRPQDLSERFASSGTTSKPGLPSSMDDGADVPPGDDEPTPEKPTSAIEKDLQEQKTGPQLPDLPSIDEEDDLF